MFDFDLLISIIQKICAISDQNLGQFTGLSVEGLCI